MGTWLRLSAAIDRVSHAFGWIASWLVLLSALISAGNALSRYALGLSSNAWLEIQWQLFAGIFLLGAPYVLCVNGHVRVDLIYGSVSRRGRLWIDILGILFFLFPVMLTLTYFAWNFFLTSYLTGERSANTGGLIFWPVKLLMPVGFALVLLQGVSELGKRLAALRGLGDETVEYEKPLQ